MKDPVREARFKTQIMERVAAKRIERQEEISKILGRPIVIEDNFTKSDNKNKTTYVNSYGREVDALLEGYISKMIDPRKILHAKEGTIPNGEL